LRTEIATDGLSKLYGTTPALGGVDLRVPSGALYGLIGPNGAGKTTLLEILAGIRRPTTGEVHLAASRGAVAFCPDVAEFEPWLSATEVLEVSLGLQGRSAPRGAIGSVLGRVGLSASARRRVGGFSRGMTTRLNLACALLAEPRVLLLDEPIASLDPLGRADIIDLLASLSGRATVIVSSHDLAGVEGFCTQLGVLVGGRLLYQGTIAGLLASVGGDRWRLELRSPAGELVARLAAQPWVSEAAEVAPGVIELHARDAGEVETHLVALLAAAGARVVAFSPVRPSLDDAFLSLTAHERRPGAPA
jgi:ABC-2 type transport system ATP-binding protein